MSTPNPYLRFASPHIVQCFEQDATFIERLQDYLDAGMSRGDSVLLFATPAHVDALALLGCRLSSPRCRILDAAQMLQQFFNAPKLAGEQFRLVVDTLCEDVTERGTGRIRIFSDLMALL